MSQPVLEISDELSFLKDHYDFFSLPLLYLQGHVDAPPRIFFLQGYPQFPTRRWVYGRKPCPCCVLAAPVSSWLFCVPRLPPGGAGAPHGAAAGELQPGVTVLFASCRLSFATTPV